MLCELSRANAVEAILNPPPAPATVAEELRLFLDELMIPLHLAYDIALDGAEALPKQSVVDILKVKGPEVQHATNIRVAPCLYLNAFAHSDD